MITFEIHKQPTDYVLAELHEIQSAIFDRPYALSALKERVASKQSFLSVHAYSGAKIVGFKAGFELSESTFYSWIGGVREDHRQKGIAQELMRIQHNELVARGFESVQTKTQNRFREMLILNLKAGFDIVETFFEEGKGFQILLEKRLSKVD